MEDIIQDISKLIKKKMQEQGVYDREGYRNLVNESMDYFVSKGKLIDDDNLEFIEDRLLELYSQFSEELSED
ncbi:MAG: hypothetical protein U9Q85_01180 [Patescibacteria group bacterium]|nr:hypothetical protein [Patescibacteria group bacterium]